MDYTGDRDGNEDDSSVEAAMDRGGASSAGPSGVAVEGARRVGEKRKARPSEKLVTLYRETNKRGGISEATDGENWTRLRRSMKQS